MPFRLGAKVMIALLARMIVIAYIFHRLFVNSNNVLDEFSTILERFVWTSGARCFGRSFVLLVRLHASGVIVDPSVI